LKIETLRVFVAVARAGSLAGAAERLHRAPSAVSMTLRQFEARFGEALFVGERKGQLTPFGARALELAEDALAQFDRTVGRLADHAAGRAGEVRVAAVPSVATMVLPGLALDFATRAPDARLEIRDMDSAAIRREIARRRVDLGIVSDAPAETGIVATRLMTDRFGLVLGAGHPLAVAGPLGWEALEGAALIANPLAARLPVPAVQRAMGRARLTAHNTATLLAMVRAGLGVTVLPALACRDAGRGVVFRPMAGPEIARNIDLVRRGGERLSPAAEAFAALLAARAAAIVDAAPPPP